MAGTVYTARHFIAVGAYRHDGLMTSYTAHGSGLLISAPSDDVMTSASPRNPGTCASNWATGSM